MSHNRPACDPPERHDTPNELEALATEAARVVAVPAPQRTTVIAQFVLAAEKAGISRRDVENIIRGVLRATQ
jgi:hypothetical protein